MEGKVVKEEKKTQFRWSKPMSRKMLQKLAKEVESGNRPNNSFKTSSFVNVAKSIFEEFGVECMADHVDNHMRTLRTNWAIICKLKGNSSFGWDENMKMVTASPKVFSTYVQEFPNHEKYLNHKIDMYDEMAIVVGKDMAKGNMVKSFVDVESASSMHVDDTSEQGVTKSDSINSEPRQSRKRSRAEEEDSGISRVSAQLGEVVSARQKFSNNHLDVEKLYDEIMKMKNFEESTLVAAFDYLVEHDMQGKAFLVKNDALRNLWLGRFEKTM